MEVITPGPLDEKVADLLGRRGVTAVVATVDEAGDPWTTPVNTITSVSGTIIRMALERRSVALANIQRRGLVMIAVLDEGNIAVGIRGRAAVVKPSMVSNPLMAMVEVHVDGFKDDSWPDLVVCQGIRTRPRHESITLSFRNVFAELKAPPPQE
ncbi:MAG: pyridoxamine 5'-phosphate oxidase family protein [Betaproteobacteria bacterium]